ncbi:Efflux ABC transporter, ATP-binding protein [hydrothermal vent metagenome]|uniref:Efflux ABC transporter, ATP-binding protein n=1 Tax=hydrothermal vent metagenome TaxID=652676 RepID=A0A3B0WPX9_9ZZZZ
MKTILSIKNLNKIYSDKFQALKNIDLDIQKGEIFALLGPNGAGKTTLIGCVTGLVNPTSGQISVNGHDINENFRLTRKLIGLVPQELSVEMFEPVLDTVNFSRGLFGLPADHKHVENVLQKLSLWEKRKSSMMTLSGGMKRRVMIAKALSHEPQVLFLDEPTAGVDVELRRDMWNQVKELKELGVTIILTTHYIEEAEEMADRIGVINNGEIIIIENKKKLMQKFGKKELIFELNIPIKEIPVALKAWALSLNKDGTKLCYTYDASKEEKGISTLHAELSASGITYKDIHIYQSKLEDIFIQLVKH